MLAEVGAHDILLASSSSDDDDVIEYYAKKGARKKATVLSNRERQVMQARGGLGRARARAPKPGPHAFVEGSSDEETELDGRRVTDVRSLAAKRAAPPSRAPLSREHRARHRARQARASVSRQEASPSVPDPTVAALSFVEPQVGGGRSRLERHDLVFGESRPVSGGESAGSLAEVMVATAGKLAEYNAAKAAKDTCSTPGLLTQQRKAARLAREAELKSAEVVKLKARVVVGGDGEMAEFKAELKLAVMVELKAQIDAIEAAKAAAKAAAALSFLQPQVGGGSSRLQRHDLVFGESRPATGRESEGGLAEVLVLTAPALAAYNAAKAAEDTCSTP